MGPTMPEAALVAETLTVAMAVAPGVYSRNRHFSLHQRPEARAARRRAAARTRSYRLPPICHWSRPCSACMKCQAKTEWPWRPSSATGSSPPEDITTAARRQNEALQQEVAELRHLMARRGVQVPARPAAAIEPAPETTEPAALPADGFQATQFSPRSS